jgi:plasmid stabilization system protein ParE
MRLIYHPLAETELAEAARFYERKVPGLAKQFQSEFESCVARIVETPARWRTVHGDIHRFLMKHFPFSILYRVEGDTVRILVVKHHKRHPDYWKSRLSD